MNPDQIQPENEMEMMDNPVSCAKKILQIESDLREGISAIQEILAMVVQNKIDLNKIKQLTKEQLNELDNEE